MKGLFVALEGIDGAGKTTQADLLANRLREHGWDAEVMYQPGYTPMGEQIRKALATGLGRTSDTEVLMFAASMAETLPLIRKMVEKGIVVITDRWVLSTIAYQSGDVEYPGADWVQSVCTYATREYAPHRTFVLDLPPKVGLARKKRQESLVSRWEDRGADYLSEVRKRYIDLSKPHGIHLIPAMRSTSLISDLIFGEVALRLLRNDDTSRMA